MITCASSEGLGFVKLSAKQYSIICFVAKLHAIVSYL